MRAPTLLSIALLAGLLAVPVGAQERASAPRIAAAPGGPAWSALTPAQQQALAPLQREWPNIDGNRKAKWLDVAARFPSLPEAERARIQERMADWSRLSPAERGQARLQFQESRQFAAEDRQARWEAYRALPEEDRIELAKRAKPVPKAPPGPGSAGNGDAKAPLAAKRNTVQPLAAAAATTTKPVSPTAVQVKPGATTTLMSQPPKAPAHQQSGLPKIAATEGFVDPKTLLPKRGPQGAAVRSAAAAASEPAASP